MVRAVVRKMPYADINDDVQKCTNREAATVEMVNVKRIVVVMQRCAKSDSVRRRLQAQESVT